MRHKPDNQINTFGLLCTVSLLSALLTVSDTVATFRQMRKVRLCRRYVGFSRERDPLSVHVNYTADSGYQQQSVSSCVLITVRHAMSRAGQVTRDAALS